MCLALRRQLRYSLAPSVNSHRYVGTRRDRAHSFPCSFALFHQMETSSTVLFPICCYDKYYQLDELEDRDSCTTELWLNADGNVEFGDTDGPIFNQAVGSWEVAPGTNDFTMHISRSFTTGNDNTDMGSFDFESKCVCRPCVRMIPHFSSLVR